MRTDTKLLIIVGSALSVILLAAGLLYFGGGYDESVKDQALERVNNIGELADEYYNKPVELGGGNISYSGFDIPEEFENNYPDFTYRIMTKENLFLLKLDSTTDNYRGKPYSFMAHYEPAGLLAFYLFDPGESKWTKLYDSRWPAPEEDRKDKDE